MRLITSLLAAAVAVSAAPVERDGQTVAVPLKQIINTSTAASIVAKSKARIDKINEVGGAAKRASGPATNEDVSYVAPITIGSTTYQLIVDTGSSNTWTGAGTAYKTSSTSHDTGNSVQVAYGSGQFSGEEYIDKVSFAGLTVNSQSIGAATSSEGFDSVDGIVGFGPVDLTSGTVRNTATVPTLLDNLYKQKSISTEVLGVYFKPESGSDSDDTNGELTLGGTDSSKYSGSISYFPKLTSGQAGLYWGISIASFTYGSTSLAGSTSGIVDTGTTLILVPNAAYNKFLSATGGTTDASSGLASFTRQPTSNFGVKFGSQTFTLTPAQYLVPKAQYSVYGLDSSKYYSWIGNGGTGTVSTIIGQKFLENYYSVFDTTNNRIGFATRK